MAEEEVSKQFGLLKFGPAIVIDQLKKDDERSQGPGFKELMFSDSNTEDILNILLPPKKFLNVKNEQCLQYVLTIPAKLSDVYELQTMLDKALQDNQARETGICPIREEIYAEYFEELIRQISISCSQRGILLTKVRNEFRSILENYQQLYISSLAYGIRVSLLGEDLDQKYKQEIESYELEIKNLESEIETLKTDLEVSDQREEEFKQSCEQEIHQKFEDLQNENKKLRLKLKEVLFLKKSVAGPQSNKPVTSE